VVLKLILLQKIMIKEILAIFLRKINVFFVVRCFKIFFDEVRGIKARS